MRAHQIGRLQFAVEARDAAQHRRAGFQRIPFEALEPVLGARAARKDVRDGLLVGFQNVDGEAAIRQDRLGRARAPG